MPDRVIRKAPAATHRLVSESPILSAHFSHTGGTIATVSAGALRFWDTASGTLKAEIHAAVGTCLRAPRAIEGDRYLLVGNEGVELYDLEEGRLLARCGEGYVRSIDYNGAKRLVLALTAQGECVAGMDRATAMLAIYPLEGGPVRIQHASGLRHPFPIAGTQLPPLSSGAPPANYSWAGFLAGSEEVVTFGRPGTLVWSVLQRKAIRRIEAPFIACGLSPDGTRFVGYEFNSQSVELWSIDPGARIASLNLSHGNGDVGYLRGFRFGPDPTSCVTESILGSDSRRRITWRLSDGAALSSEAVDPDMRGNAWAWSADGRRFVVIGRNGNLRVYEGGEDPVGIGQIPPEFFDPRPAREAVWADVSGESLYLNPTGTLGLWVIGDQAALWRLPG